MCALELLKQIFQENKNKAVQKRKYVISDLY